MKECRFDSLSGHGLGSALSKLIWDSEESFRSIAAIEMDNSWLSSFCPLIDDGSSSSLEHLLSLRP